MMPTPLTRTDYVRCCALIGVEPDLNLVADARAVTLPAWLSSELLATQAAQEKLSTWCRATSQPWDVPADPATVLVSLSAYGDPAIPHAIARTLCTLPPPVRDYLIARVTWLAVGLSFAGWCGARVDFGQRPWMVTLSRGAGDGADRLPALIAHEGSHAWLLDEPEPGVTLRPAFADQTIHDLPISQVRELAPATLAAVIEERRSDARDERQAKSLVRAWGFQDVF